MNFKTTNMRSYLLLISLYLTSVLSYGQNVSECDSAYIYKHFLFYNSLNNTFDDIDEPFIEEFWETEREKAIKYYFLASYLKSIPVSQRVIMISYLDEKRKFKAHKWIYNNLQSQTDTSNYFRILNTDYGIPYSRLNITEDIVKEYCPECTYK